MTSALTSQETTNCKSILKLLKVVSSKALSDVRANYTLFLTTTQFYSRTVAWLPWLVQGHLSLIFPCPPPYSPTSSCPCPWKGHSLEEEEVKKGNVVLPSVNSLRAEVTFSTVFSPVSPISEALCLSISSSSLLLLLFDIYSVF